MYGRNEDGMCGGGCGCVWNNSARGSFARPLVAGLLM